MTISIAVLLDCTAIILEAELVIFEPNRIVYVFHLSSNWCHWKCVGHLMDLLYVGIALELFEIMLDSIVTQYLIPFGKCLQFSCHSIWQPANILKSTSWLPFVLIWDHNGSLLGSSALLQTSCWILWKNDWTSSNSTLD